MLLKAKQDVQRDEPSDSGFFPKAHIVYQQEEEKKEAPITSTRVKARVVSDLS